MPERLRLLILGAHPDDAEFHCGGLASLYRRHGHAVRMVSVTNGESGHQTLHGAELAAIRRDEAQRAAETIGAESAVWEFPDGRLQPTLEVRERIIREIRTFQPDLVLTHRTNDYHPDHRAVGTAVQDASFLVTVPAICSDTAHLRRDPVVGYLPDLFTRPAPLRADVVVDVSQHLDSIIAMLACHASQFFDWLPYNERCSEDVPAEESARRLWLRDWYLEKRRAIADRYPEQVSASLGAGRASERPLCEIFEISEYAAPLDADARERLFGFMR